MDTPEQSGNPSDVPPVGREPIDVLDADHEAVDTPEQSGNPSDVPPAGREPIVVLDIVVGTSTLAAASARAVGRRVQGVVRPVAGIVLRPPMVPRRYQAETLLAAVARQGASRRPDLSRQLSALLDLIVPTVAAAVLARIDLNRIVKEQVDLAGLAEGVIAEVDLAEIIRQSTGSVASDTVQGVRMQGISGDEAVGRAVGRLRLRLHRKDGVAAEP